MIVKPLPKQTHLTPGEDLNMSITINASITSTQDDITVSLGHSARGDYEDLTKHMNYEISEDENEEEYVKTWKLNVSLPYPYSQSSGDVTLSVGDHHSGDITTTRLIIGQEGKDGKDISPFFDPVPKPQKAFTGQNVLIDTKAMGSTPITVNMKLLHCFS